MDPPPPRPWFPDEEICREALQAFGGLALSKLARNFLVISVLVRAYYEAVALAGGALPYGSASHPSKFVGFMLTTEGFTSLLIIPIITTCINKCGARCVAIYGALIGTVGLSLVAFYMLVGQAKQMNPWMLFVGTVLFSTFSQVVATTRANQIMNLASEADRRYDEYGNLKSPAAAPPNETAERQESMPWTEVINVNYNTWVNALAMGSVPLMQFIILCCMDQASFKFNGAQPQVDALVQEAELLSDYTPHTQYGTISDHSLPEWGVSELRWLCGIPGSFLGACSIAQTLYLGVTQQEGPNSMWLKCCTFAPQRPSLSPLSLPGADVPGPDYEGANGDDDDTADADCYDCQSFKPLTDNKRWLALVIAAFLLYDQIASGLMGGFDVLMLKNDCGYTPADVLLFDFVSISFYSQSPRFVKGPWKELVRKCLHMLNIERIPNNGSQSETAKAVYEERVAILSYILMHLIACFIYFALGSMPTGGQWWAPMSVAVLCRRSAVCGPEQLLLNIGYTKVIKTTWQAHFSGLMGVSGGIFFLMSIVGASIIDGHGHSYDYSRGFMVVAYLFLPYCALYLFLARLWRGDDGGFVCRPGCQDGAPSPEASSLIQSEVLKDPDSQSSI